MEYKTWIDNSIRGSGQGVNGVRSGVGCRSGEGTCAWNILQVITGRRANLEREARQNRIVDFLGENELVYGLVVFCRGSMALYAAFLRRVFVFLLLFTLFFLCNKFVEE